MIAVSPMQRACTGVSPVESVTWLVPPRSAASLAHEMLWQVELFAVNTERYQRRGGIDDSWRSAIAGVLDFSFQWALYLRALGLLNVATYKPLSQTEAVSVFLALTGAVCFSVGADFQIQRRPAAMGRVVLCSVF